MAKIGIYSGTFDPVHAGHLAFAEVAIEECGIDLLYMLPEPKPRRKQNVSSLEHRQKMLELAARDSGIKTKLPGMADRHDVASSLKVFQQYHPDDQIVLLMGADVFLNIDAWSDWQQLLKTVEFAVALRTEDDGEELVMKLLDLPEVKLTKIVTNQATVSSSLIRQQVGMGEEPKNLDPKVLEYIKQNKLYLA